MIYDLDSTLRFGKYKGYTIEDLLNDRPDYLLWLLENVDDFEVDKALQDAITRAAR